MTILPKCLRTGLVCKLDASHLNRGKDSQGEEMYPQGRMSHHFKELRVGDYLAVKGHKVYSFLNIVRVVARAILENPKDMTNVHLIYANVTYEDILLKEELDSLVAKYPGRFKVYYVLN
ncbi:hypothetical protein J1N35_022795 [Gossypium stocksii]|uniref:Oxidoreductase FAD/NAD(P)-binding domain-containing protein n=1 Tax=Gossypium stocksii TaxID=47602 RepID=A0A9D4A3T5_9ROSI|nr:hypothetical protein J1N35_022795 [Gossypium stocksii]